VAISTGVRHACAVTSGGAALCWGWNDFGQLGDSSIASKGVPIQVVGLESGVQAISAGYAHTCTLSTSGVVSCWGNNSYGQLGDGSYADALTPKPITSLGSGIKTVSVGASATCVIDSQNRLLCWGRNAVQLFGLDTTDPVILSPTHVSKLATNVIAIAKPEGCTCAIVQSGKLLCAGYNGTGMIDDSGKNKPFHEEIMGLASSVTDVSIGLSYICARSEDGLVRCWGENNYGQLGNYSVGMSSNPTVVAGLEAPVRSVTAGEYHACAITHTGMLKCWGRNNYGQLGNSTGGQSNTPVQVTGFP